MANQKNTSEAKDRAAVSLPDALSVLAKARPDEAIVVTSMNTTYIWPKYSRHPLDFHFLPSTMGGAVPLALGLALARPKREVIVFSGDGSLLMSLGSLITTAAARASNLTIILIDNGVYEVTGGQKTAAEMAGVDFEQLARGSGIRSVVKVETLKGLRQAPKLVFDLPGPRMLWLVVEPSGPVYLENRPDPMDLQIRRIQTELGVIDDEKIF